MTLEEVVSAIGQKHKKDGFEANPPATQQQIDHFQQQVGFLLPDDFVVFYKICNGFCCDEDIFVMKSIEDILENASHDFHNGFYFSDYMINSDLWSVRIDQDGYYEIVNVCNVEIILTASLQEFLKHFLEGNVFDKGGLYDWQEQLKSMEILKVRNFSDDTTHPQMESQRIEATTKSSLVKNNFQHKFKNWFQKLFKPATIQRMIILKKIEGNELNLFFNGKLIYKRWLDTGESKVFDVIALDKYTLASLRDLEYEKPIGLLAIKARLKLKSTEEGGRHSGFISGYRPDHVFEYNNDDQILQAHIGDIIFDGASTIEPGEEREVSVRFLLHQRIEKYLYKGRIWWIHEGGRAVGQAEII